MSQIKLELTGEKPAPIESKDDIGSTDNIVNWLEGSPTSDATTPEVDSLPRQESKITREQFIKTMESRRTNKPLSSFEGHDGSEQSEDAPDVVVHFQVDTLVQESNASEEKGGVSNAELLSKFGINRSGFQKVDTTGHDSPAPTGCCSIS